MGNTELISSRECYILRSAQTEWIYLDADFRAQVFIDRERAEKKSVEGKTFVGEPCRFRDVRELMGECYAGGACSVSLNFDHTEQIEIVREKEKPAPPPTHLPRRYYNNYFVRNVSRFADTLQVAYLKYLGSAEILTAVKIRNHDEGADVTYATVQGPGCDRFFFTAFTGLEEFEAWKKIAGGEWRPIQVYLTSLFPKAVRHGFIVNPAMAGGKYVILTQQAMEKIPTS